MSGSLIGALRVTLGIDTAAFEEGLGIAQKRMADAGKKLSGIGESMVGVGSSMSIAITAPMIAFGKVALDAANESAQAIGQVNAALDSMGPVAGKTSEQLQKAAEDLQHLSTFDDDDILKSVTANMLTFGNVTGDTFDRAQLAALNLSARLGQDLQSSAIQVGKALNDPIKGVTALSRVGVSFTADQKAMIASMVEAGDIAGAQGIILGELEKQYGGSAKAMRDATPGAALTDAWNNFQETVGAIVAEVLPPLTAMLTGLLDGFNNLSPGTQSFIVGIAAAAAAIGPVLIVVGSLVSAIGSLAPVFAPVLALIGEAGLAGALGAAATAAAPFLAAGAALAAVWALFGDKIGPVLQELWTKVQDVLGPKLIGLFDTVKQVLLDLWNGPFGSAIKTVIDVLGDFGAAYLSILGEVLIRIVGAAVEFIKAGFKIVGDVLGVVGGLLTGDFAGAWESMKSLVGNVIDGVLNILDSLIPGAKEVIVNLASGFATWLGDLATRMITFGKNIIQGLVNGILAAPEAVWNALKSVVLAGVENIRKFLGIASPSRLFMELGGFVTDGLAIGIEDGIGTVSGAMTELGSAVGKGLSGAFEAAKDVAGKATQDMADQAKATTEQVIKDFADMAAGVINSLGGLKDAIKNGDFFDVVLGVLDVVTKVVGAIGQIKGGFGGGDASVSLSGRASGGPVLANTPYIVGERRAELFVPSTSGRIEPNLNATGRSGGGTVNNYFGPGAEEFWGKINRGHADAARRGATGGAQMAIQQIQRGQKRALA